VAEIETIERTRDFAIENIRFHQDRVYQMKNPIMRVMFLELMELKHHEKQLDQDIYLHTAKLV
jgi:hypothetical protein